MRQADAIPVEHLRVSTFVVPTDAHESDGTFEWDRTTMVVVEAAAGGETGLGWTYASHASAVLVHDHLAEVVLEKDAMDVPAAHAAMTGIVRNLGRRGAASMAISAVDVALWDLKAKLLGVPLARLLGMRRACAPVYGSGGFTSYDERQLRTQLAGWVSQGIPRVKMKVGREPGRDPLRVEAARTAIGDARLFVDANGAYTRKQALALASVFRDLGVDWFEEPVSSDDHEGLRLLRDRAPAGLDIAAGEYGWDLRDFRCWLQDGCVDVLQADATRCGITGMLGADALCEAFATPLSAHCAPQIHAHVGCACQRLVHLEYFHDHARIEGMLLDGALVPRDGALWPDLTRPGLGVELKAADAQRFAA
ncbi:MAG TPA: enolase C-terminal domain-like protein [Polyangiaceae bacterium]